MKWCIVVLHTAVAAVKERMVNVAHKILILSGKGGVGKSSFSACLARGLATNDQLQVIIPNVISCGSHDPIQIGLLDIDICGPSIPKLMGLEREQVHQSGSGWSPVVGTTPPACHVTMYVTRPSTLMII